MDPSAPWWCVQHVRAIGPALDTLEHCYTILHGRYWLCPRGTNLFPPSAHHPGTMDEPLVRCFLQGRRLYPGAKQRFLHDPARSKQLRPGFEWYWSTPPQTTCRPFGAMTAPNVTTPVTSTAAPPWVIQGRRPSLLYPFHAIDNKAGRRRAVCLNFIAMTSRGRARFSWARSVYMR